VSNVIYTLENWKLKKITESLVLGDATNIAGSKNERWWVNPT
jgi:hypothetical protein